MDRLKFFLHDIDQIKDNSYDIMLIIDVFEHVVNYFEFLEKVKKKGKYKVFHIPLDINILGLIRNKLMASREGSGHLHYFTKDTALATLSDTGYEIIDWFYTNGSTELPKRIILSKIKQVVNIIISKFNKDLSSVIFGNSIIVLVK